jgi:hypothetical protein
MSSSVAALATLAIAILLAVMIVVRRRRPTQHRDLTGVVGRDCIQAHHTVYEPVPLRPRDARRLEAGDRVRFDVDADGQATHVRCYRRLERS